MQNKGDGMSVVQEYPLRRPSLRTAGITLSAAGKLVSCEWATLTSPSIS